MTALRPLQTVLGGRDASRDAATGPGSAANERRRGLRSLHRKLSRRGYRESAATELAASAGGLPGGGGDPARQTPPRHRRLAGILRRAPCPAIRTTQRLR